MLHTADIVLLSVLCVLSLALATPTDSKSNYCKDGGVIYKKGQSWSKVRECQQNTCGESGEVYVKSCAEMAIEEGSGWTISKMDLTKTYPYCCPQPIPPYSTGKPHGLLCDAIKKETDDTKKETGDTKKETDDSKKETEATKKELEGDIVYQIID